MNTPVSPENIESTMSADLTRPLNLPTATLTIRRADLACGWEVHDPLRNKWVALTPEERVRQTFARYLVETCGHSPHRIAHEVPLRLNKTRRRADTIIYDDKLHPFVVVEYKAPSVELTAKVLEQALRYNMVFRAPFLIITNGLRTITVYGTLASGADLAHVPGHPTLAALTAYLARHTP